MSRDVRKRWRKALALMACQCEFGARPVRSHADCWSLRWEYWNNWDRGHHVLASLTLDGLSCEDLP